MHSKTDTALSCMLKWLRSVIHPQAGRENTNALLKCCSVSKLPRWELSADMTVCHIRCMSNCPLHWCLSKIRHGLSSSITVMHKFINFCHFSYSELGLKQPQTLSIKQQLLLNKSTLHSLSFLKCTVTACTDLNVRLQLFFFSCRCSHRSLSRCVPVR